MSNDASEPKKKNYIRDLVGVTGLSMLGYGLFQVYPPSAFIVVGVILTAMAVKGI